MNALTLARCLGLKIEIATKWAAPVSNAMGEFDILNGLRQSAFLAQICHESGAFRYTREIWGPTKAQERYEIRADLGNIERGDGVRFLGRGLIQITGRANYRECGNALGIDLIGNPSLLEQPDNAARSAGWFWHARNLNALADAQKFELITRRINGGLNGQPERLALYQKCINELRGIL